MLLDYLHNQRAQLKEMAETLNEELKKNDGDLHETEKFRELIASENEPPFSEFSPHVVSTRAQEKLGELDEAITRYHDDRDRLISQRNDIEASLHSLSLAIEEAQRLTSESDSSPTANDALTAPVVTDRPSTDISSTLSALRRIKGIVTSDPFLAQSLISELIVKLEGADSEGTAL